MLDLIQLTHFLGHDGESQTPVDLVAAFEKMKFSGVTVADLDKYMSKIKPPKIRGATKHGEVPWKDDLFGSGTNPTEKVTVKSESVRTKKTKKDVLYERWAKNAGLLND